MACHEKHLNFKSLSKESHCNGGKINSLPFKFATSGENLITNNGKFHVGKLQIPADPSWPKIPQRRFPYSYGDIDQSGVVTVTRTPRRSSSIGRTSNSVTMNGITSKENFESISYNSGFVSHSQSMPPPTLRRRPGSADPRFKKVTTVKSQIKSMKNDDNRDSADVSSNQVTVDKSKKNEHSRQEKDINVERINQQEAEKLDKKEMKEAKNQDKEELKIERNHRVPDNCQQNEKCLSVKREVSKNVYETTAKKNCKFQEDSRKKIQETEKTKGNEMELKKIMDLLPDDKCLSLKMTSNSREILEKKEEINCVCSEKSNSQIKKQSSNLDKMESNGSESMSDDENYRKRCKEHNMDDKESFFPATTDSELIDNETVTTLNRKKIFHNYYNSPINDEQNLIKDYELIDYFQTHGDFYKYRQSIDYFDLDDKRGKFIDNSNYKNNKIKSEQNLSHGVWQNFPNSEPLIPINQRRCATSYSQTKKSDGKDEVTDSEFAFLWPEQQQQQHRTRRKSSHGYTQKLIDERRNQKRNNLPRLFQKKMDNSNINNKNCGEFVTRFNETKVQSEKFYQDSNVKSIDSNIQEEVNSPRTETDIASEKPKRIPYKTQKLLNKSYWEYYRKLNKNKLNENSQKQCDTDDINNKNRGNMTIYEEQLELSPPEIRTLKRCSVLSTMINKKLDSDSQPILCTKRLPINSVKLSENNEQAEEFFDNQVESVVPIRTNDDSSVSSSSENKRKNSQVDIKLIKLKTIAFFGILMYLIIIFLPMLYDHIFHEDYDEYADLTYIELAVDYVVSSYREAFNGILEFVNRILYRPLTCKRCNGIV
ncbi:uncharacterized protein LOC127276757 isoform X2 [Leptopilina boulardi]|uniref:uncharacterized protein LOC127276757 isoform X2 n=1 Tax=Leptopilina boulardi TaxID=63433 RepID=UPI0021F588C0|nr:uncharacterized protein LOC127276757 isoform X2 [Leptopilina boulardi]